MQPHIQFYFIPNKHLAVIWSPKCACGAIANWAKNAIREFDDFDINPDGKFGSDARFNLNRRGYNFNLYNLRALARAGSLKTIAVSTRDPVARMRSAFINKFLIHKFVVLQQLNQLELFSKDFLRCAKRISFASPAKTIRMSRSRNTFRISLSSFIETVSSEAHTRLIDGHFKPQLLEVNHLDAITSLSSQVRVLPLRTERLKEDLSALNNVMGFNYMPGKDNVSDMPAGWELSDSEDSVKMSNQELISQKIVPSLKALNRWLSVNPQVQKSFMNRFDWDYKLISFLQGLDDV